MTDPNIVSSGLSRTIELGGRDFRVEIYKLEHEVKWVLEVVGKDGSSTVWDQPFNTDQDALAELLRVIQEEGASAFLDNSNVLPFPKK
jgi:hypothetical protein